MTDFETRMLDKQDEIIALLKKLIVVCAAGAISEPQSSVNSYDRQAAANYTANLFTEGRWREGKYP